jgi:hypothetical protein
VPIFVTAHRSDGIEATERITPFSYWFSRLFESRARVESLELSELKNGESILIIAPPTELYLGKLLRLNSDGENHLVYFVELAYAEK